MSNKKKLEIPKSLFFITDQYGWELLLYTCAKTEDGAWVRLAAMQGINGGDPLVVGKYKDKGHLCVEVELKERRKRW